MASPGETPFPTSPEAGDPGASMAARAGNGNGHGSAVFERVVQGAHQAIDSLAETAAPHVQRLQEGFSSAGGSLHTRVDQAREMGDEWAESLRVTVRENPLAAVATALAVGVLIARLTR